MAHVAAPEVLPVEPSLDIVNRRADSDLSSLDDVIKDDKLKDEYGLRSETSSLYDRASAGPLAPSDVQPYTAGAAILHFLHIRRRPKDYDLDAVATQESVFDGPLATHYVPNDKYENKDAFDPAFRWTKREERALRRKIDLKIFLWILIMFTALDVDRGAFGRL